MLPKIQVNIKEYLNTKGIIFREQNGELVTKCLFSDCDKDSKGNEAHLYFSAATGQYDCKKCGSKGNLTSLSKHFGDNIGNGAENKPKQSSESGRHRADHYLIEKCNREMPDRIRKWLNERGITDELIADHFIGYGKFYDRYWIVIPVRDEKGKFSFLKLRKDPEDISNPDKSKGFPVGSQAQIYGLETLKDAQDSVVICEGEFDRLVLLSQGIPAVTSTNGAMTFKQEWVWYFGSINKVYVCFDNDEAGRKGSERVLKLFEQQERLGVDLFNITLPEEVGEAGDVTDFFIKLKGSKEDFFGKYCKPFPEQKKIDISKFLPMTPEEVINILGLTIKNDEANKLLTFLAELSAFTEESQLNVSNNAPSSAGKSYISIEVSNLFPSKDVLTLGHSSPTAFFHDVGKLDAAKNEYLVDLSRKIIIFLDQPNGQLLKHLRPILSHDKKEIILKITDKNNKGGNRTKTIRLRGYPVVVFCSAGLIIDEQEATRFLLLSPETSQEKIRESLYLTVKKETDQQAFKDWLNSDPQRVLLKERIEGIKQEHINDINLGFSGEHLQKWFFSNHPILKPRHQRDIKRVISITKCLALLNLWWRKREGNTITATEEDLERAIEVWDVISESQELNLPPYVHNLYKEVLVPLWLEKNNPVESSLGLATEPVGLKRKEVLAKHYKVYGRHLNEFVFREQILPLLENSGLISQEEGTKDKRTRFIYLSEFIKVDEQNSEQNNSVQVGGENDDTDPGMSFEQIALEFGKD